MHSIIVGCLGELTNQTKDVKTITTTSEPEQSFLSRQLDLLQKDTTKDPRQSFRNAIPSSTTASSGNTTSGTGGGVVGPMGNTGLGLNLPGVEKAMLEMEGSGLTGEELKEKFARLGRRVSVLLFFQSRIEKLANMIGNEQDRPIITHSPTNARRSTSSTQ